jgi:uncharacterized protein YjlB
VGSLRLVTLTPQTFHFDDDGAIPNSPLPVLVYRSVKEASDANRCKRLFAQNGWLGAWQNGIYSFHHFHSIAHEVLGVVAGDATVMLGGPPGREFEIKSGDVLVLPAGTGHCNLAEHGLLVVGAYPDGMEWDLCRGDPAEHDDAVSRIRAVPLPMSDPVGGTSGPLPSLWTS